MRDKGIVLPIEVYWNGENVKYEYLYYLSNLDNVDVYDMNEYSKEMKILNNRFLYKYLGIFISKFDEFLFFRLR